MSAESFYKKYPNVGACYNVSEDGKCSKSFQISYSSKAEKDIALEMLANRPKGMVVVDKPSIPSWKKVVDMDNMSSDSDSSDSESDVSEDDIDGVYYHSKEEKVQSLAKAKEILACRPIGKCVFCGVAVSSKRCCSECYHLGTRAGVGKGKKADIYSSEWGELMVRCEENDEKNKVRSVDDFCRRHIYNIQRGGYEYGEKPKWCGRIRDSQILIEDSVPCNPPCVKRLRACSGWKYESKCGCYWSEVREELNEKKRQEAEAIRARAVALAEVLMMPAPEKPKKPLTAKQEQALATRRANAEKKKADKEREKFEAEAEKGRAKKQKEALAKQVKIEKAKRANQLKMAMKALGC